MRFIVTDAHKYFFAKHGYIELESPLAAPSPEMYPTDHDLWRHSPTLRKTVLARPLAEVAAQLFKQKTLCIAFDQLLGTAVTSGFPNHTPSSLQSISSISPLAGAVLFHLSGTATPSPFIPSLPQHILFFSPDLVIPWEVFFQEPHASFLLIAYATPRSLYVHEKKDPHLHSLKKLGYAYGDRLVPEHHPVVYK